MYTKKQIREERGKYKQGDVLPIITVIYRNHKDVHVRRKAVIDGVYKHGIMVSFPEKTPTGTRYLRRWIDYVDILNCKWKKYIYARTGRTPAEAPRKDGISGVYERSFL